MLPRPTEKKNPQLSGLASLHGWHKISYIDIRLSRRVYSRAFLTPLFRTVRRTKEVRMKNCANIHIASVHHQSGKREEKTDIPPPPPIHSTREGRRSRRIFMRLWIYDRTCLRSTSCTHSNSVRNSRIFRFYLIWETVSQFLAKCRSLASFGNTWLITSKMIFYWVEAPFLKYLCTIIWKRR